MTYVIFHPVERKDLCPFLCSLMNIHDPHPHKFHIPVLGLSFSIDTPLKVARFGISSVISIIEDELIEDMRAYHSLKNGIPYIPISTAETDYRAQRITAYLNLLHDLVEEQSTRLKNLPFSEGSELSTYFELLPDDSPVKKLFRKMTGMADDSEKDLIAMQLKRSVMVGSIDVNIMAKVDNARYSSAGEKLPDEYSDALSALRGYANSKLSSSIVFSAGYNPKLYSYAEHFNDFFPDAQGNALKKIILKVSDYRSALIQGKILARKGLWVSEFRIESGLNCGGHAFPTDGFLLGPILEDFKTNRSILYRELFDCCNEALLSKQKNVYIQAPNQKITVQGGMGTAEEQRMMLEYYQLDSVGWGSPFLLVPEVTNVDDDTLQLLANASQEDYYLSNASPLGVPFNNFRKSSSENQRIHRIKKGRPGSPCYKNYLASDTEFTELPICTASRKYQHLKAQQLKTSGSDNLGGKLDAIEEKDCLCEGLTAAVRLKNNMYLPHKLSAVAICPGPNLAYFSGIFSLKQMVDHIYGRVNLLNSLHRSHFFINELKLYINYFRQKITSEGNMMGEAQTKYFRKCKINLLNGIEYYKKMFDLQSIKLELSQLELQVNSL